MTMTTAVVVARTFCVDPMWGRLSDGVEGLSPRGRLHRYRGTLDDPPDIRGWWKRTLTRVRGLARCRRHPHGECIGTGRAIRVTRRGSHNPPIAVTSVDPSPPFRSAATAATKARPSPWWFWRRRPQWRRHPAPHVVVVAAATAAARRGRMRPLTAAGQQQRRPPLAAACRGRTHRPPEAA